MRGALLCLALMCALNWGLSIALIGGFKLPETERLLFQATLPGLNEELIYRGFAMAMIDRAFRGRSWQVLGAPIGMGALLTSVLFGVQHGMGFVDGQFVVSWLAIALTGALGLLLAWMRARTGSLVAPVLAHNIINVGGTFLR